jgi:hypothetical protein
VALSSNEREYQRSYQLDRYNRWMSEAREYLGGVCVICGTTEDLQIDHIDPNTKSFTFGSKRPARAVWDAELKKCQLLCLEHHKEKTAREWYAARQHGTYGMYQKHGCRCDKCRSFMNNHMKEYKRSKKQAPVDK